MRRRKPWVAMARKVALRRSHDRLHESMRETLYCTAERILNRGGHRVTHRLIKGVVQYFHLRANS